MVSGQESPAEDLESPVRPGGPRHSVTKPVTIRADQREELWPMHWNSCMDVEEWALPSVIRAVMWTRSQAQASGEELRTALFCLCPRYEALVHAVFHIEKESPVALYLESYPIGGAQGWVDINGESRGSCPTPQLNLSSCRHRIRCPWQS